MKAVSIAIILTVVAVLTNAHVYEQNEINCVGANDDGRMYRDIHDASQYWICPAGEDYGEKKSCPIETAFLENEQKCVPWGAWYWKAPYTR